jgi:TonB family protein
MARPLFRAVPVIAGALMFVLSTPALTGAQSTVPLDAIEAARRYTQQQRYDLAIAMLQEAISQLRAQSREQAAQVAYAAPPLGQTVRVGGAIPPPVKLRSVAPAYPADARAANIQGRAILEITLNEAGEVSGIVPLRSPSPSLERAAIDAVRQWRYRPTLMNGEPVGLVMTVTVDFSLDR